MVLNTLSINNLSFLIEPITKPYIFGLAATILNKIIEVQPKLHLYLYSYKFP